MELDNLVSKKLAKLNEIMKKVEKIDPDPQSVTVGIKFYPIRINEQNECFVPFGTKDEPAGLTTTDADYILFMYPDGELGYVEVEIIKAFIKEHYKELKKDIDPYEFRISGVVLPMDLLAT